MGLKFVESERGKKKLVDGGFIYVQDRVIRDVTHWKCELFLKKRCRARVHTKADEIVHRWRTEHVGHTGDAAAVEVAEIKTQLMHATENSSLAPKVLVSDCLSTASGSAIAALPPIEHLKRNVHNKRKHKCNYPALPKHRRDLVIPRDLLHTKKGDDFILYDSGKGHEERMVILGTLTNLSILKRCKLWMVDGTFKSTPVLFYQLYTIHGLLDSATFPLIYALLPNKTYATYKKMLTEIKTLRSELAPATVLMDFEQAVMRAFHVSTKFYF